jgi:hypothetical protein
LPSTTGNELIPGNAPLPARVFASIGLTPAATTRTSSSALTRTGRSTSVSASTSGPPACVIAMARIVAIILFPSSVPK